MIFGFKMMTESLSVCRALTRDPSEMKERPRCRMISPMMPKSKPWEAKGMSEAIGVLRGPPCARGFPISLRLKGEGETLPPGKFPVAMENLLRYWVLLDRKS